MILWALIVGFSFFAIPSEGFATPKEVFAQEREKHQSIIIEVEGNPIEHKKYLETYHPFIDVIATYEKLFNGLALQGSPDQLEKMGTLDFVKSIHTVQTYQTNTMEKPIDSIEDLLKGSPEIVIPSELNNTIYTGEGITVGVVDTGIDYNHPDLQLNYAGGYDLVDLDEDPMETTETEGAPTNHGSHVAGIIAANGSLQGVAPSAEIRAYRALGPGGSGTSVQVIAAMEQAVKDGVDIINLSLGNSVNGPDYPTSVAVNRAADLGIAVVIANGNSGPNNWTVGAPATAANALAVGAFANSQTIPMLYDSLSDKKITMLPMQGSISWELSMDYELALGYEEDLDGKIALVQRGKIPFYELAKKAQEKGAIAVIIYNNEAGSFRGALAGREPLQIPVVSVSKEDGEWLVQYASEQKHPYIDTIYEKTKSGIAPFSSRGPVTVNWDIKPDILAPGTNILSTVPGGYMALQGTSMAAPHVVGVIALMKEAKPKWTNEQIYGALKTTAIPITDETGQLIEPIIQGMGKIDPKRAIETPTIIYNPSLSFGKINDYRKTETIKLTIENTSNQTKKYAFTNPRKQTGLSWNLPMPFEVEAGEKVEIPIDLSITSPQMEKGIHQGWLTLSSDNEKYHLPYLFINETADYPKATGFEFTLKSFSEDEFVYRLYLTDETRSVEVELYDPQTLIFDRTLFRMEDTQVGMNEGYIRKRDLGKPGRYLAIITVQLENGTYESYETEIVISPDL
ncbi:S8 family serine peptidase [Ornithinibacillus californiensis]|uniref:S8 family serine peptidase n=1 Tax=Ornithinibacillus californiensis TaxID=161536 RepID=UPI00064DC416|nr:S8 family serine peptidase [Ornithinibacillus californiensis]